MCLIKGRGSNLKRPEKAFKCPECLVIAMKVPVETVRLPVEAVRLPVEAVKCLCFFVPFHYVSSCCCYPFLIAMNIDKNLFLFFVLFRRMGDLQWSYNRELALQAGLDPLPPVVEALYKVSSALSAPFTVLNATYFFFLPGNFDIIM